MPFQVSSATDAEGVLALISSFASSNGWTVSFSSATVLGLNKGATFVTLEAQALFTRPDAVSGGTVNDRFIAGGLFLNFIGTGGFNHNGGPSGDSTGSPTSNSDNAAVSANDMVGPFNSVFLFTNSTGDYIHIVVQTAPGRYNMMSFGILDTGGYTTPEVPYFIGSRQVFWTLSTDPSSEDHGPNNPTNNSSSVNREFGLDLIEQFNFRIQPGVLDNALGFDNADRIETRGQTFISQNRIQSTWRRVTQPNNSISQTDGFVLDGYQAFRNQATTGGIFLSFIPVIYRQDSLRTYLGQFPDIRLVDMSTLGAAEEFTQGSDTWQAFPMMQKGDPANLYDGANPNSTPNSGYIGYAIKKIT